MTCTRRIVSTLFAALLMVTLIAVPATAQQGAPQQQPAPEVEVDDDELETIAETYVAVQTLTDRYNQLIQQSADAEEAQGYQSEYAERANEVVRENDLTVDRYDNVIRAATADDELRNRLLSEIENIMGDEGGN